MADVRPFRGLRYNLAKVGDLGSAMSPPYDVVSQEEQSALSRRSPYNVIRLELAQANDAQAYLKAGKTLAEWRHSGVLLQESAPAFYVSRHEFTDMGRTMSRTEVTAAVRLEEAEKGIIRPHENTRSKAKQDRMSLMLATRANISPVMLLFEGIGLEPPEGPPPMTADLGGGERLLTWPVTDPQVTALFPAELASRPLYIADGHHRYETALAYRDKLGAAAGEAARYVMAALISISDPGLLILPYHRLLRMDAEAMGKLKDRVGAVCVAERVMFRGRPAAEVAKMATERLADGKTLFAVWGLEHRALMLLSLSSGRTVEEIAAHGHSRAWAGLSNSVFREALLMPALGLQEEEAEGRGLLSFSKDALEAVQAVNHGMSQVAFMCKAVPVEALKQVSDLGERLPPKSTFFYPKLPTGLVLRSLEGAL